jgi:DNA-binding beta-propeller fold protein YncE
MSYPGPENAGWQPTGPHSRYLPQPSHPAPELPVTEAGRTQAPPFLTETPTPPPRPLWRRKPAIIAAAIAIVIVTVAAITIGIFWRSGPPIQTTLPFTGLHRPAGVAVGADGSVYVADLGSNRVLKLTAGS